MLFHFSWWRLKEHCPFTLTSFLKPQHLYFVWLEVPVTERDAIYWWIWINTAWLTLGSVGTSPHFKGTRGAEVCNAPIIFLRPVRMPVAELYPATGSLGPFRWFLNCHLPLFVCGKLLIWYLRYPTLNYFYCWEAVDTRHQLYSLQHWIVER